MKTSDPDPTALPRSLERQAAEIDRRLVLRVHAGMAPTTEELRRATQRELDRGEDEAKDKARRDHLLNEALLHRLRLVSEQIGKGHFALAQENLKDVERDYVAQRQINVRNAHLLRPVSSHLVVLDDPDPGFVDELHQLDAALTDFQVVTNRQPDTLAHSKRSPLKQFATVMEGPTQQLLNNQLAPETYTAMLLATMNTVLDRLDSTTASQAGKRLAKKLGPVGLGIGSSLTATAIWEEGKQVLQAPPAQGSGTMNPPLIQPAPSPSGTLSSASVPLVRGNAARTGEQPGPGPEGQPQPRWRSRWFDYGVSSAVVANGAVYFSSFEEGKLHAAAAENGAPLWEWKAPPMRVREKRRASAYADTERTTPLGSPSIVEEIVYVETMATDRPTLFAIDTGTGRERWRFSGRDRHPNEQSYSDLRPYGPFGPPHNFALGSSPVVDGVVYWAETLPPWASGRRVYALDARSGRERWRFELDDRLTGTIELGDRLTGTIELGDRLTGMITLHEGRIYLNAYDSVVALDASIGRQHWRRTLRTRGTPAIVDGVVYVAGFVVHDEELQSKSSLNMRSREVLYFVQALDAETGRTLWRYEISHANPSVPTSVTSPAVVNGLVYVGARSEEVGVLYAIDASSGREKWRFDAAVPIDTDPVVAANVVYICGGYPWPVPGQVHWKTSVVLSALDASSGHPRWQRDLTGWLNGMPYGTPAVIDGCIYLSCGSLLALEG